jgi:hypothetical protein
MAETNPAILSDLAGIMEELAYAQPRLAPGSGSCSSLAYVLYLPLECRRATTSVPHSTSLLMPRSNHGQMFARQRPGRTELEPAAYGLSLPSPGYATG